MSEGESGPIPLDIQLASKPPETNPTPERQSTQLILRECFLNGLKKETQPPTNQESSSQIPTPEDKNAQEIKRQAENLLTLAEGKLPFNQEGKIIISATFYIEKDEKKEPVSGEIIITENKSKDPNKPPVITAKKIINGQETPVILSINNQGDLDWEDFQPKEQPPETTQKQVKEESETPQPPIDHSLLRQYLTKTVIDSLFQDADPETQKNISKIVLFEKLKPQEEETLARYLGFITTGTLKDILGLPEYEQLKKPINELKPLEKAQKKLLEIISQKEQEAVIILSGQQIQEVLEELNPNVFKKGIFGKETTVRKIAEQIWKELPNKDKESGIDDYLKTLGLSKELLDQPFGSIAELIDQYHKNIQQENLSIDKAPIDENSLAELTNLLFKKSQIDQVHQEKIKERVTKAIHIGGGLGILLLFLVWQGMTREMGQSLHG